MFKLISLSLLSFFLLSGCATMTGGPVKLDTKGDIKHVKEIDKLTKNIKNVRDIKIYYFDVKPGETLGQIIRKIRKDIPNINLLIDKNVNMKASMGQNSSFHGITIFQYLNLLNDYNLSSKKFQLKLKNNVYRLSVVENKEAKELKRKQLIEKKTQENIKVYKSIKVNIEKSTTYSEFFGDILDIYGINTKVELLNSKDFLNSEIGYDFKGSLYNFIDSLKVSFGYGVDYYGGLKIYDYVDKTYELNIPAIANDNTKLKSQKENLYESLENQIKNVFESNQEQQVVSSSDSNSTTSKASSFFSNKIKIKESVHINKSAKTVSVTATPRDIKRIDKIIKNFNDTYSKAIYFKVSFYNVELSSDQAFGVDMTGLLSDLVDKGVAYFTNNSSTLITQTASIANPSHSFKLADNTTGVNKLVIESLNKYGNSKLVQTPSFVSLNAIPYFFNITNKRDYIKEVKDNFTSTNYYNDNADNNTINSSKEVKVETLETGFSLSMLPYIDKKSGDIYVILNPQMKDLVSLEEYTYDSGTATDNGEIPQSTIQLPTIKELNLGNGQTIKIRNGETNIIGGFIVDQDSYSKEGMPGMDREEGFFDGFFSTKKRDYKKSELIVIITATILDN